MHVMWILKQKFWRWKGWFPSIVSNYQPNQPGKSRLFCWLTNQWWNVKGDGQKRYKLKLIQHKCSTHTKINEYIKGPIKIVSKFKITNGFRLWRILYEINGDYYSIFEWKTEIRQNQTVFNAINKQQVNFNIALYVDECSCSC